MGLLVRYHLRDVISYDEFEKWVNQSNIYLNSLLLKKDPDRYKYKYGTLDTDERILMRQS